MFVSYFGILGLVVLLALIIGAMVLAAFLFSRSMGTSQASHPNLFPCPDCGRLISVRAAICPHCGGPVTTK